MKTKVGTPPKSLSEVAHELNHIPADETCLNRSASVERLSTTRSLCYQAVGASVFPLAWSSAPAFIGYQTGVRFPV